MRYAWPRYMKHASELNKQASDGLVGNKLDGKSRLVD